MNQLDESMKYVKIISSDLNQAFIDDCNQYKAFNDIKVSYNHPKSIAFNYILLFCLGLFIGLLI